MKKVKFIRTILYLLGAICICACSQDEPTIIMNVTKVGNYFQDTQGLHYRISGNGVVIARDMYDHGYQHLPKSITIPASITYEKETYEVIGVERRAFEFIQTVDSFFVSPKSNYFSAQDGILFNKDVTELIRYPQIRNANSYIVPSTVKRIADWGIYYNQNLRTIDLSNVEEIGCEALRSCTSLFEIKNTQSIRLLDTCCMAYTLISGMNLPNVRDIRYRAFLGCDYLQEIRLGANLSSISDDCLCIENSMIGCISGLGSYYIEAVTPPTVVYGALGETRYRTGHEPTLFVPNCSVESYKSEMGKYFSKIEPIQ